MRTTPVAAAPFSGRLDSLPRGPAQAAARDLPGCREREVGRGKRSPVRHGAVWKNPGEASQRAGKGERPGGRVLDSGVRGRPAALSDWPLFPGPSTQSRGRGKSLGACCEEKRVLAARRPSRVRRPSFGAPWPRPHPALRRHLAGPWETTPPRARWYGPPGTFLTHRPRPRAGLRTTPGGRRWGLSRTRRLWALDGSATLEDPGTCGAFFAHLCGRKPDLYLLQRRSSSTRVLPIRKLPYFLLGTLRSAHKLSCSGNQESACIWVLLSDILGLWPRETCPSLWCSNWPPRGEKLEPVVILEVCSLHAQPCYSQTASRSSSGSTPAY